MWTKNFFNRISRKPNLPLTYRPRCCAQPKHPRAWRHSSLPHGCPIHWRSSGWHKSTSGGIPCRRRGPPPRATRAADRGLPADSPYPPTAAAAAVAVGVAAGLPWASSGGAWRWPVSRHCRWSGRPARRPAARSTCSVRWRRWRHRRSRLRRHPPSCRRRRRQGRPGCPSFAGNLSCRRGLEQRLADLPMLGAIDCSNLRIGGRAKVRPEGPADYAVHAKDCHYCARLFILGSLVITWMGCVSRERVSILCFRFC